VLAGPDVAAGDLAARVSEALAGTGVVVASGSQRAIAEVPRVLDAGERLIPLAASFGGMSLVLAVIMVAGTFGLSIQQQRREIALLRTIGATPRQVRRMLRRETLVVAILAALLGVVPGIWFSKVLYEQLRDFGLASRVIDVQVGQIPPIVAAVAGVVTALLGAMIAARRASRIRPIEALQEAEVERKPVSLIRLGAGVLFLAGSVVMSVLLSGFTGQAALESAIAIVLLSVLGLSCLSPALGWVSARLLGSVVGRVSDGPGYLAAASARTNIGRFAASLTPLMLAVGFASSMIFMQTTAVAAAEGEGADTVVADHVISSSSGGLPGAVADEAGRVPGVREATGLVRTSVVLGQESVPALGVSGGFTSTLKIPMVSGDPDGVRGDGIALSTDRVQRTGLRLGDRVAVRLGDGPAVDMRLVAIFQSGGSTGEALVPTGIVLGHTISGLLDEVLVSRADGADDSQVVTGLASLADRFPGVTITDKAAVYAYAVEQADKQSWINYLMAAAVLAYAAIASVNTIAMATARRTREFALLRLTGATRRQVMRMMRWESLMVAATATVLGTVMAAETLIPLSIALTGSPAPFTPALVCFAIVGGATLLALLAVEVPTRLALRRRLDLSY
jgi:putative ABC transport system permease protein